MILCGIVCTNQKLYQNVRLGDSDCAPYAIFQEH